MAGGDPLLAFGHPPPCRERAWATRVPDGNAHTFLSYLRERLGVRFSSGAAVIVA